MTCENRFATGFGAEKPTLENDGISTGQIITNFRSIPDNKLKQNSSTQQQTDEEAKMDTSVQLNEDDEAYDCILAISKKDKKIGIACYNDLKSTIFVAEIFVSNDLRETIQSMKLHLEPTLFLIGPHILADESFCKLLTCSISDDRQEYQLKPIRSRSWDYSQAITNISSCLWVKDMKQSASHRPVEVEGTHQNPTLVFSQSTAKENYNNLSSIIDFNGETLLVKALGALILQLQSTCFVLENDGKVSVKSLYRFDLGSFVRLNETTFRSLQIFHTEFHPNLVSGKGRAKEGFSLFALLDQTRSRPGRLVLREWMMRPLRDVQQIRTRQNAIELFMHAESTDIVSNCHRLLSKIAPIPRCFLRLRQSTATFQDWLKIASTIQNALLIQDCLGILVKRALQKRPDYAEVVHHLNQRISRESLLSIGEEIATLIDFDLTRDKKQVTLRIGCDKEWDRLKAQFDDLEEFLTFEARRVLEECPQLSSVSCQYLPQIGYLTIVLASEKNGIDKEKSWRFVFAQGEELYYKTPRMELLDEKLGDLQATIRDREDALLRQLAEKILSEEVPLTEAMRACAEVDVLISLSRTALSMDWQRPEVTKERVIIIKDGRHPLQELSVEQFIPNDTYLAEDHNNLAIITGPNYSGKSVYIKQVAILCYLAHLGSFVPCQKAIIGLVDGIYTRIASQESNTVHQSTFTIDLTQMNTIFRQATKDSLVLVDEFGKGSAEADGISLLMASMAELQRINARTLLTTHFLEVFHYGLIPPVLAQDLCYRMDVHVPAFNPSKSSGFQTLVPLFKLAKGVATCSAGFSCAVMAGLPLPIVRRADFIASSYLERNHITRLSAALLLSSTSTAAAAVAGDEQQQQQEEEEEGENSKTNNIVHVGNLISFNPSAQKLLSDFLCMEHWAAASDEQVLSFARLLREACPF